MVNLSIITSIKCLSFVYQFFHIGELVIKFIDVFFNQYLDIDMD